MAFPVEVAAQVFPEAEKLLEASPPSLSATFAFLTTPEGIPVAVLTLVSTASSELTAQSFAPFRGLGTPLFEETVRLPYTALQRLLDQVAAPALRYYGRGNFLDSSIRSSSNHWPLPTRRHRRRRVSSCSFASVAQSLPFQ